MGIASKVLIQTLPALERDGLVSRTAYDESPPRVEYELTPLGLSRWRRSASGPRRTVQEILAARYQADWEYGRASG